VELDGDSCTMPGLRFYRFGQSAGGRWAVVHGSGSCIEAEMVVAPVVEIATVVAVATAETELVAA
jgi:hypothetical protein